MVYGKLIRVLLLTLNSNILWACLKFQRRWFVNVLIFVSGKYLYFDFQKHNYMYYLATKYKAKINFKIFSLQVNSAKRHICNTNHKTKNGQKL